MNNRIYSKSDIRCIINNNRRISGSHTQCRFSGGIGCFHHSGTACCENNIRFLHNKICKLQAGYIDPSDDTFRCTCLYCCLQNNSGSFNGRILRTGMRTDNNPISCFQSNQSLKDCSGGRISCRDNRCDKSHRLCNFFDSVNRIFLNNIAGLCVFISIVNILGGIVVFDYLILNDSHSCLFDRHFCQWNTCLIGSNGCSFKYSVNLFLSVSGEKFLCFFHRSYFCFQSFRGVNNSWNLCFCFCHSGVLLILLRLIQQ